MNPNEADHLPKYSVRPKFQIEIDMTTDELVEKIKQAIKDDPQVDARIIEGHATLYIIEKIRHYWSPELTLRVEELEEDANRSELGGRYGPRPTVWTMFVFFYSLIGFCIMIAGLFGFTNYSLGNPAPTLWTIPVLIVIFLSLYLVSYFGQKLGHDHMVVLQEFLEKNLDITIDP